MSYRLRHGEADTRDIRRIFRAHVEDAQAMLTARRISDGAVHETRRLLKNARATLRLIRDAMSTAQYRHENEGLRDVGRPLSAWRDARILIDTLDNLASDLDSDSEQGAAAALRQILQRERRHAARSASNGSEGLALSRIMLRLERARIGRAPVEAGGWRAIRRGLKRVYSKGRSGFGSARFCAKAMRRSAGRTAVTQPRGGAQLPPGQLQLSVQLSLQLHEWRKQVKYLLHQLRLFEPLWPGPIGKLADQAHVLSGYLGDDHDLAMLRQKALEHRDILAGAAGATALLARIDHRRERLQGKALRLGARLYDEKPAPFVSRIGKYWKRWQRESDRVTGDG
ncbi:MAG TPA: CHAD domain-containing protein [Steroidobacteraceae bacterium]|jgi:CHAD domain-containing protein